MFRVSIFFVLLLSMLPHTSEAADTSKKLLSTLCREDVLKERLADRDDFKPVPPYGDSYWRDSIPENMRLSYIKEAEKYLGTNGRR